MKRAVQILALLFSVLFLSACAGKRLGDSSVDVRRLNTFDGISVYTEQSEYPVGTKEIQLNIENNSEYEASYVPYFILEVEMEDTWKELPFQSGEEFFEEIAYLLPPGKKAQEVIDLDRFDFKWKPGKYRIVKTIYVNNGSTGNAGDYYLFSAEFTLTSD